MAQYLEKSAVISEIERRIYTYKNVCGADRRTDALISLKNYLDTLEVKEVEESTADDRGMAEKIIINLKRVEQDYHIDLTKEMEWIRNKSRKGE